MGSGTPHADIEMILADFEAAIIHACDAFRTATRTYIHAMHRSSHTQPLQLAELEHLVDIENQRGAAATTVIIDHALRLAAWLAAHHPDTRIDITRTRSGDVELVGVHDPSGHVHAFAALIPEPHLLIRALRKVTGGRLPTGCHTLTPDGLGPVSEESLDLES